MSRTKIKIINKGRGVVLAVVLAAGFAVPAPAQGPAKSLAPRVALAQGPSISTKNVGEAETDAGNLVADAVRAAASADVAFVPAAAFKSGASVPRPASGEQAAQLVSPSSDLISVLNLRGAQILAALERSVSFAPQSSVGFLQVSGLRFTYNTSKDGKRVQSVMLNGAPLEAAKVYKVATTKPLAGGGNGYFQIWDADENKPGDTGKTLAAALAELAKARGGSLNPSVEGRINRVEKK